MPTPEDMTRLNRHVLFSTVASGGVFIVGLIGIILYFKPGLARVLVGPADSYQGKIIWLLVGLFLIIASVIFLLILIQWPGQLKKTILHTVPRPMLVKLEVEQSSDSTIYYALLSEIGNAVAKSPAWRVNIWIHPPDVRRDTGRQMEGNVYFHPKTGWPVAIEVPKGVLWAMAGAGAVKRLSD